MTNPRGDIASKQNKKSFVGDANIIVEGGSNDIVDKLQHSVQKHQKYLFASGEKLAFHKCARKLIDWRWPDGRAELMLRGSEEIEQQLILTSSCNGERELVPIIDPNEEYMTLLGAKILASGIYIQQIKTTQ